MTDAIATLDPEVTEASTSRFVQTPKWRLHFHEAGEGHPLILLHGTGPGATGWSNFAPNIGPLSRHFRVIALDLPGWGKSDACDPMKEPRQPAHAEAVKLLMDELGIERATLVGNSMGGGVTLQFAADYNDRLALMVTMGSGFFGVPSVFSPGGMSEGIRVIVETYSDPSPENFRRLVKIMAFDPSFGTDELAQRRSAAALENPDHLANWLKPIRAGLGNPPVSGDLMGKLSIIKTPALFIHGRDDRVVPLEMSLRLISVIPNSRLHVFNRCGHWAQIEHAEEFNALVTSFVLQKL